MDDTVCLLVHVSRNKAGDVRVASINRMQTRRKTFGVSFTPGARCAAYAAVRHRAHRVDHARAEFDRYRHVYDNSEKLRNNRPGLTQDEWNLLPRGTMGRTGVP